MRYGHFVYAGLTATALWSAVALAEPDTQSNGSPIAETGKKAGDIVTQPARDVGVASRPIPPVLAAAAHNPYDLTGARTCGQLAGGIKALNSALGPDFVVNASGKKENRVGKLAEAGGQSVVNAFIPFRGLVREISGAAPQERRLNAAIDAGYARRGFLRGMQHIKGCGGK